MQKKIVISIVAFVFLISLVFLLILKPKTSHNFWKQYFILAVEKSIPSERVKSFLDSASIEKYIYKDSKSSALNQNQFPFGLLYTQTAMLFSDESQKFQLFYIPISYLSLFTQKTFIENIPFDFSLDTDHKKNYSLFVFISILCLYLLFKTKQRWFFFFSTIFLVTTSFFYTSFLFSLVYISLIYLVFFISLSYKRKYWFSFLTKNVFFILNFVFFLGSLFLADFSFFIRAVFISTLSFSSIVLFLFFEKIIEGKKSFTPIFILSSLYKKEAVYNDEKTFLPPFIIFLLLFVLSFFNLSWGFNTQNLVLPYPLQQSQKPAFSEADYEKAIKKSFVYKASKNSQFLNVNNSFPNLAYFIADSWNFQRFPYVSVYDENFYNVNKYFIAETGDTINFSYFVQEEFGLKKKEKAVYTFNNSFIASILESVEDSISVEALLKSQNCFTEIVYEKTSKMLGENNLQIKLFFSCVFSFSLLFLLFLQKKKRFF